MYVRTEDLDAQGRLKPGVPVEPLILRANAGDCIEVNLTNALDPSARVFKEKLFMAPPFNGVNPINSNRSSSRRCLASLAYIPNSLATMPLGALASTSVGTGRASRTRLRRFGKTVKYQWYAGKIDRTPAETWPTLRSNSVRLICSRLTPCIKTSTVSSAR